jgi:2-polyprenyl-3-methyl-5-hydroxy-6-metoxy-1,4-benzoquinol methylase
MLTNDKTISTPQYWDGVYNGARNDKPVDSSNGVRKTSFDRFAIVVAQAEGPLILDVGSGHARICQRIKAAHPEWTVIASDQSDGAKAIANYEPYWILTGYDLPLYHGEKYDTVICTQAMEYMVHQDQFIREAAQVGKKLLITVPRGDMSNWSQLRIYDEKNVRELLEKYGTVEVLEEYESLILAKVKFND